jgi:hypothetical protein
VNGRFNIYPLYQLLANDKTGVVVATHRQLRKTVPRTKKWDRIRLLVRYVGEIVGGIFAVFYLLAAIALAAAVFFYFLPLGKTRIKLSIAATDYENSI